MDIDTILRKLIPPSVSPKEAKQKILNLILRTLPEKDNYRGTNDIGAAKADAWNQAIEKMKQNIQKALK